MAMHRCPGRGCTRSIGANELACPPHWRQLPERLRRTIKTSYRHDDPPTPAIAAAIEWFRAE